MIQTIFLVGETGMFGSRVAHHLLKQLDARVRLLVRDIGGNKDVLGPLAASGAELIAGDPPIPARSTAPPRASM